MPGDSSESGKRHSGAWYLLLLVPFIGVLFPGLVQQHNAHLGRNALFLLVPTAMGHHLQPSDRHRLSRNAVELRKPEQGSGLS